MRLLNLNDAVVQQHGLNTQWSWEHGMLEVRQWHSPTGSHMDMLLNHNIIWEREGVTALKAVWPELTAPLFQFDILCEPLELNQDDSILCYPLPEMNSL